ARCNDSHIDDSGKVLGDPMEGALLVVAAKGGVDPEAVRADAPRLAEVPFDSTLKLMATFHEEQPDQWGPLARMEVKGAADVLLARSVATDDERAEIEAAM